MSRRDWGSGSIDERSPGRWRVTVPLPSDPLTGKRRRRRFTVKGTISDARQALNEAIHERDHGGVDPNRITTGEWLMVWLDGRVRDGDLGLRAALGYRSILQNHLIPAIGHVLLQDLRPDHVRRMKDLLSESLAPATVRKTLVVLGTALKSAVALELLAKNPASAVRKPSSSQQEGERRALDKDEIKELLRVAAGTVLDMPIRFALATGARQSELLGAMWGAIDLEERTFRVMQALHYVDREFRLLRLSRSALVAQSYFRPRPWHACVIIVPTSRLSGSGWAPPGRTTILCSPTRAVSIGTGKPSTHASASYWLRARSRIPSQSRSTR